MINTFKHFFLVIIFIFSPSSHSYSQSFSLSDLIKMAKMDDDEFDTFVSSKKFVFLEEKSGRDINGVTYAYQPNQFGNGKANKFVTLYSRFYGKLWHISYQTLDNIEYSKIKSQIKPLGFKFIESKIEKGDDGEQFNFFKYIKGKSTITLYVSLNKYEINYTVDH